MTKKLSVFLLAVFLFSCQIPKKSTKADLTKKSKPNIILIMTDDQGWFDVGFNGNKTVLTPNLDKLAKKGVVLNRFYSASTVCSPTRASVITGRNPYRINIPDANTGHMTLEEVTLPEILKKDGYKTAHFGKWHLGTLTKTEKDANRGGIEKFLNDYSIPTMHGYDEYFCTESKVPTYDPLIYPAIFKKGESKRFGWRAIENKDSIINYGTSYWVGPNKKITTNVNGDDSKIIMDRVIPFINKSQENNCPFFSTIWFHTPHLPVVSDSIHRNMYNRLSLEERIYYGTITAMDEQVGRLWDRLNELGIQDNTMIWFCSDNGPERETPGSAGVFREGKRSLYEGGLRVPAFMIWNNTIEGGRKLDIPSVTSDYLPTVLDILNLPKLENRIIDGESILEALKGQTTQREKPIGFLYGKKISWVNNQYKLISTDNGITYELYDLINDKSEKSNIINNKPEITKKMKKELSEWLVSVEKSKKS